MFFLSSESWKKEGKQSLSSRAFDKLDDEEQRATKIPPAMEKTEVYHIDVRRREESDTKGERSLCCYE